MTGEARFDENILQSLLQDNQRAIEVSEGIIAVCQREKEQEEARIQYLSTQIQNIRDRAKVFDDAEIAAAVKVSPRMTKARPDGQTLRTWQEGN